MPEVRSEFQSHDVTPEGLVKIDKSRECCSQLLSELEVLGVTGRELSIVITKLQELSMFAVRGLAVANQKKRDPA